MKIGVFAGSHREFVRYMSDLAYADRNNSLLEYHGNYAIFRNNYYFYIYDRDSLRGRNFDSVVYVGTYFERDDYGLISDALKQRGVK
jgi:hypothetical protein